MYKYFINIVNIVNIFNIVNIVNSVNPVVKSVSTVNQKCGNSVSKKIYQAHLLCQVLNFLLFILWSFKLAIEWLFGT